jgi:sugar O-acyltransferase (sialic acid O-acetyltransferase NeuD family)
VIIIGTGGFAIELAGLLSDIEVELQGFIGPEPLRKLPGQWLGNDEYIEKLQENTNILIAIGNSSIRSQLTNKINEVKLQQQTFIHPSSYISKYSAIAEGAIIYPNVTIHAGVVIEKNVLVNSNATIGHETKVGDFSNIGPGSSIGGCCDIGRMVRIGIGVSTLEKITISDGVTIGAGATVIDNIYTIGTYVGVPAKRV